MIAVFVLFYTVAVFAGEVEDIDHLLKNEKLMRNQIDCLLDRGTCSKDDEQKKGILFEYYSNHSIIWLMLFL